MVPMGVWNSSCHEMGQVDIPNEMVLTMTQDECVQKLKMHPNFQNVRVISFYILFKYWGAKLFDHGIWGALPVIFWPKACFFLTQNMVKIPIFHGQSQFFHIFHAKITPKKCRPSAFTPQKAMISACPEGSLLYQTCARSLTATSITGIWGPSVFALPSHIMPTRPQNQERNGNESKHASAKWVPPRRSILRVLENAA